MPSIVYASIFSKKFCAFNFSILFKITKVYNAACSKSTHSLCQFFVREDKGDSDFPLTSSPTPLRQPLKRLSGGPGSNSQSRLQRLPIPLADSIRLNAFFIACLPSCFGLFLQQLLPSFAACFYNPFKKTATSKAKKGLFAQAPLNRPFTIEGLAAYVLFCLLLYDLYSK